LRVLSRVFGLKRDKVTGEWRKLYNEELNLYCSPNVVCVIKSRRMSWAGHVARVRERRGVYGVLMGTLRKRDYLGDPGINGRIIFKWIFRKWAVGGMDWIELAQNRVRQQALVNVVMNLRVPQNAGYFLTS
jgi:hypothetical protein